jgi:NhaP-type Na+/H+ and K+/H+ antiporter
MEEKVVKEVKLENNQTLMISDVSRKISEDAYIVIMKAKMEIPIEKNLFSDKEQKNFFFEDIIDKIGKVAVYEYLAERNFIMADDKDALFERLVDDFFETLVKYISMSDFPKKLILKRYKDKVDNKPYTIKAI